jgi:hypothetical protein
MLFVCVRPNSHKIVGFAVKIAVSFEAKKRVSIRFVSRCIWWYRLSRQFLGKNKIKLNRSLVAANSVLMGTVDFVEDMNTAYSMDFCLYTFADNRSSSSVLLSTKWQ